MEALGKCSDSGWQPLSSGSYRFTALSLMIHFGARADQAAYWKFLELGLRRHTPEPDGEAIPSPPKELPPPTFDPDTGLVAFHDGAPPLVLDSSPTILLGAIIDNGGAARSNALESLGFSNLSEVAKALNGVLNARRPGCFTRPGQAGMRGGYSTIVRKLLVST